MLSHRDRREWEEIYFEEARKLNAPREEARRWARSMASIVEQLTDNQGDEPVEADA